MSKITNYVGLTQVQGHEYYSHDIENDNLSKNRYRTQESK